MKFIGSILLLNSLAFSPLVTSAPLDIASSPLFLTQQVAPLNLIIMTRDHRLYYEAYNDASDIDGDGSIDLKFKPSIEYYGYFDSKKCYSYGSDKFYPSSLTSTGKCSGKWSGNFLNYLTTSRMDAIRKVLYGGYRYSDGTSETLLERAYIPQDAHSWGKEYTNFAVDGYNIADYAPLGTPASGRRHLFANVTVWGETKPKLKVKQNANFRIWQWVSKERVVADSKYDNNGSNSDVGSINNYTVRVKVCDASVGLEPNCRTYANGYAKPIGLLQEYGENDSMQFGLLTGSYTNNLQGGVLRKNISSLSDEIDANTGKLTSVVGIIKTIDRLTTVGFGSNHAYETNCGWITDRHFVNGECRMWGNPLAEMMYEGIRYFAGKSTPTSSYNYSSGDDTNLGLPKPSWKNPYTTDNYCAYANFLVISDIYPTYDSDNIPGSAFKSVSGDLSPSFNASSLGQSIFTGEGLSSMRAFIGQSGSENDEAPTAKTISSFGNIRGLAPEAPSKQGSYYSASAAYYAWKNDINPIKEKQSISTYAIALTSPLPELSFNVGGQAIRVIPYAKSPFWKNLKIDPTKGKFQPTNAIVDFYIDEISNTKAVFRINFEDVQQGADHDMDAIVKYTITVNSNKTITVAMDSTYAAGGIKQHMGYIISGTTKDGLYLEVRDIDTSASQDVDYFLDTPPGVDPGGTWKDGTALPLTASRTFTPSSSPSAALLKNPLWYAAKWGGFDDSNDNGKPDLAIEYDKDNNGVPDNYFLATSALKLKELLAKAFESISANSGSLSSAGLNSGFLNSSTRLYQALFSSETWEGQVLSFKIDTTTGDILTNGSGPQGSLWDAAALLKNKHYDTGRQIITYKPSSGVGIKFRWPSNSTSPSSTELDLSQTALLNTNPVNGSADSFGEKRLEYLRGNTAFEQENGGSFRNRSILLGDIIHSNPVIVGTPKFPYPSSWPGSSAENSVSYANFRQLYKNRKQVIYIGANDGMLHGFDAESGQELFGYIPSKVFQNLGSLTKPDYSHQYYVDGSPASGDVFYSGGWHSVLVGSLGAGGQGVFSLDITNPTSFSETNAAKLVLWEFTDSNDADMGLSFGKVSIVRLNNGKWAAIFANGYNNTQADTHISTTGNAVIYVVDIATGQLIKKFDTQTGMLQDPLSTSRPNGMSAPLVVDINDDYVADYIYAGDLFGNLWKIDISDTSPNQWDFSFNTSGATPQPLPLFTAKDASGNHQAITAQPAVARDPHNFNHFVIYFGTGSYFTAGDKADKSLQSVYGLYDSHHGAISSRAALLQQAIVNETSSYRIISNNTLDISTQKGWYLDLKYNGVLAGERVTTKLTYRNGKLIFSTIIPSSTPCDFGGDSWLMELEAFGGGQLAYSVFDINGDGAFDDNDKVNLSGSVVVSGMKSTVGLIPAPAILSAGEKEHKYLAGTSGSIQHITENPGKQIYGRQSWHQMK